MGAKGRGARTRRTKATWEHCERYAGDGGECIVRRQLARIVSEERGYTPGVGRTDPLPNPSPVATGEGLLDPQPLPLPR